MDCSPTCYDRFWGALSQATLVVSVSVGKESACNVGDLGLIPGLGRSPGEGNGNPLQHSCLENSMNRGAWRTTVHGAAKSGTRLSDFHFTCFFQSCLSIS